MSTSKITVLASIICILGAAFYMYEFTLQVSLGVMTNELMQNLSLNAATLGIVSSLYYYGYTPMQIPAGLLHDRFGPHRVLTVAILLCSLGALVFSYSETIFHASMGRLMMGIGSAFSFTGALILITRWFPLGYFPILSGIVQFMSCVGAIFGELPLALAVDYWGWRTTMFDLAIIGFVLAITVFLIVRDFPSHEHKISAYAINKAETRNIKHVFGRAQSWWIAFYSFLVWAPITAFAGLWGVPFLVAAYNISTESASLALAALWIGIGLSAPLIGWISERIQLRNIVLTVCSLLGAIGSFVVIYFSLPNYFLYLLLFLIGIAGSAQSLAFSVVRDATPPKMLGAAIGFNNMATVAGGAILQPIIGFILQFHSVGKIVGNVPVYHISDYQIALFMIPLCYLLAAFVSFKFIRETHCKIKY